MRLWGWRRRRGTGDDEFPEGAAASAARDEQLSAYLDDELDEHEHAAVEDALAADPALAVQLNELGAVRDALGALGELRAPRPFTLEAPPTALRGAPGRLELIFRMGAVAAAVAFAVVLAGDVAGLGDEGRPRFGGVEDEQASDAPQAAAVAPTSATALAAPLAATPLAAATRAATAAPIAEAAAPAATSVATPAAPVAAEAAATPEPTAARLAAATATPAADAAAASPTATIETRAAARTRDSGEAEATPAADQPAPAAAAVEARAEATPAPTAAAEEAAASDDAAEAAPAATPAAAAEAPAPAAPVAPAVRQEPIEGASEDGDGAGRALRRAEQGLLLAAAAFLGLSLLLARRRRGGAA